MSKKNIQPQLNRTIPIRAQQQQARQQRIISYMLEESRLQEPENNWRMSANVSIGKEQLQTDELRKQVQQLKDKDAVNRLTISKMSNENHQLRQQLAETTHKLERQQSLMRADRVYIQTLDKQVRRLKELLPTLHQQNEGSQQPVDAELQDYEQQNQQLLAEVEKLMFAWIKKSQSHNAPCITTVSIIQSEPPEQPRPPSRSTSKKKPVLR